MIFLSAFYFEIREINTVQSAVVFIYSRRERRFGLTRGASCFCFCFDSGVRVFIIFGPILEKRSGDLNLSWPKTQNQKLKLCVSSTKKSQISDADYSSDYYFLDYFWESLFFVNDYLLRYPGGIY